MEWNGHSNLAGMESSSHSGRNGMTPFQSGQNGVSSQFWQEWNDIIQALHSDRIGHSNLAGLECHSFDNLKKCASR